MQVDDTVERPTRDEGGLPTSPIQIGLTVFIFLYWGALLWYAWTQALPRAQLGVVFLGGALIMYLVDELDTALDQQNTVEAGGLVAIAVLVFVTNTYMFVNFDTLFYTRVGYSLPAEYALGTVVIVALAYLTYRSYGMAFLAVFLSSIVYGYVGPELPGLFFHSGYSPTRIISILVWEFEGFYGSITRIVATWVALFILYAGLLKGYGAFDLVMKVSFWVSQYIRSGVAQAAVIASMIIGSINGAQTANAAMTGSITIPMMKQSGIEASSAASIESVASSGGQIMPPIMGAAAFLMASFLGITYFEVLAAGLLPAAIFFVSVSTAVHFKVVAQQDDQHDTDRLSEYVDADKSRLEVTLNVIKFVVPFVILLYLLGIAQWTVSTAALYTCIAMIAMGVSVPVLHSLIERPSGSRAQAVERSLRSSGADTIEGFRTGGLTLATIAIIVAAINGIVDLLVNTGVPGAFALALQDLSGGSVLIAVVVAMAVCILLGLGMPTVAAYSIVALLIAPALIEEFAFQALSAHYFVFYAAVLSGLTPPIAIAVVVTSELAGANFWKTSYEAIKLALPLFVLPFVFVFNPEIVTDGFTIGTILSGSLTLAGAVIISYGLNSVADPDRFYVTNGSKLTSVVLGVVAMVHPTQELRLVAVVLAVVLYVVGKKASTRP